MSMSKEATEFQRRRNLPGVEVRYMNTRQTSEVVLTLMGRELGAKTTVTTRGKITSVTYILPKMKG